MTELQIDKAEMEDKITEAIKEFKDKHKPDEFYIENKVIAGDNGATVDFIITRIRFN